MNALMNFGKYLYAVPFLIFGLFHMMGAKNMAGMVPIPGGEIWVYITGLGMIAVGVSMLIGKMDKLAAFLLGLLLLILALSIHLPSVMADSENHTAMASLLKDLALAGGAWMYGANMAKDNSVVG